MGEFALPLGDLRDQRLGVVRHWLFTVALARWLPHPNVRLFVITGFLGGYTTFSTFAYESVTLWERGELVLALANMTGSVVAGFAAVFLGIGFAHGVLPSTLVHSPRTVRQTGVSGVEPATPFLVVASETTPLEAESVPSTTGDFQGVNPLPDARNGRLP